MLVLKQLYSL